MTRIPLLEGGDQAFYSKLSNGHFLQLLVLIDTILIHMRFQIIIITLNSHTKIDQIKQVDALSSI